MSGTHTGRAPWEIGAPQPAMLALADDGLLRGRVLDVGCGSGEHTLMAAAKGLDATGIDLAENVLEIARRKARERGLGARFMAYDALRLGEVDEVFDTALDSLHLHALSPSDRARYLDGLHTVLRPGGLLLVLCYSDQQTSPPIPPHRLSRSELELSFADGWAVESIEATTSASTMHPDGVAAWRAICRRL